MLRKALLVCGILSSILYAAMTVLIAQLSENYSSAAQTISELSAIGAPTRAIWILPGACYTILVTAFGWGVWKSADGYRPLRTVGGLVVAYGALGLLWPFAPMHMRETLAAGGGTFSDTLHLALSGITVLLMLAAIRIGANAFGSRFRLYSIVSLFVLLGFGAATFADAPSVSANLPTPWIGVWERINLGVFLLWIVVLASALLRMPNRAAAAAPRDVHPAPAAPADAARRAALVVCYSRTGATRLVADAVAAKLGCDVEEIVDRVSRHGWLGYLRGGFDAFFGRATELQPIRHDPAAYELIVVGTPVWDRSLPPPARAYLADHKAALRRVAFFCTEDRFGAGRVFRQMTAACGRAPLAVLALHRDEITPRGVDASVAEFVDEIVRLRRAA